MCGKETEKTLEELIDEADEIFRYSLKREESRSLYEKALKIAEEEERTPEIEYILGTIDLVDEKWENAIKHFDESINLKADFFKSRGGKGYALYIMDKYEEAIACYDKSLEIDPKDAYVWYYKGASFHSMAKHEEAVACYDKSLEINPKDAYAWHNKGFALYFLGKYEESAACFDKGREIDL